MPEIAAVQPCWRPVRVPPLDVSRPQIQAEAAWKLKDKQGKALTGKGVLIADFDTGVDFFHPMLWFAAGDTLSCLDVNRNGSFDAGTNAVDKNRNNAFDSGVTHYSSHAGRQSHRRRDAKDDDGLRERFDDYHSILPPISSFAFRMPNWFR